MAHERLDVGTERLSEALRTEKRCKELHLASWRCERVPKLERAPLGRCNTLLLEGPETFRVRSLMRVQDDGYRPQDHAAHAKKS